MTILMIVAGLSDEPIQPSEIAATLEERDRRLLFEILFEEANEATWEEAQSCVDILRSRQLDSELERLKNQLVSHPMDSEYFALQRQIGELQRRKAELMRDRAGKSGRTENNPSGIR